MQNEERKSIISESEILAVYGNASFGSTSPRQMVDNTLLKYAAGYHTGSTATAICKELGLIGKNLLPTKKGRLYLREIILLHSSGRSMHEKLSAAQSEIDKLKAENEKTKELLSSILFMSEDRGVKGCTHGDTDHDSISAVYGYSECLNNIKNQISNHIKQ